MPYSHTRRPATLRVRRLATLAMVFAVALPFVEPTVAASVAVPSQKGSGNVEGAFQVKFRTGVSERDASAAVAAVGGRDLSRFDDSRVHVVELPQVGRAAARQQLLSDPRVESVENDAAVLATLTPTDPHWDQEWNMRRIRLPEAWQHSRGESSTIIAIIDTGVDPNHPDVRGRVLRGWDFHNDDRNAYDDDGHGTAVATTAAGAGNDRVGMAGVCWRCKILPVKVLNGSGHGTQSNLAAGIRWAVTHGADVINMSIAGMSSTTLLRDAVAYAVNRGVVVVAAAGNDGSRRRSFPAGYSGVISVAATNQSDRLYSWSNRGSWVTMAAPGCSFSGKPKGKWDWLCGTSLAAPVVAGTAALMKSRAPRLGRVRLTQMLLSNTQRVRLGLGHGRLDAARAMRAVSQAFPTAAPPTATPRPTAKPTATPRRTPTPTPKATPKPTPKPTGTPTQPRQGQYEWRGTLGGDDHWDRSEYYIRGHVHVSVNWSGADDINVYVQHPNGDVIKKAHGYFELDVQGGTFTFTVQQDARETTNYKLVIKYGVVE